MPQTGPRTAAGKAASSRNAVKHGFRTSSPVITGVEDPAEWERFRQAIVDAWQPEGAHETFLAGRIASLAWRLDRIPTYEAGVIETLISMIPGHLAVTARYGERAVGIPAEELLNPEAFEREMARSLMPSAQDVGTLVRYEAALHRQHVQTCHELEALQLRRTGGQAPLARLDVSGPPGL